MMEVMIMERDKKTESDVQKVNHFVSIFSSKEDADELSLELMRMAQKRLQYNERVRRREMISRKKK